MLSSESPLPLIEAEALARATAFVKSKAPDVPRLAVILGSGLGAFAERVQDGIVIPTAEIPHYPRSTVAGHAGRWIIGSIAGKKILAMQGRVHMYEGYPPATVVFPVHVMAELGIGRLIVTNAAGGINPLFVPGDLMLIDDHINMMFANPLRGQHRKEWGDRWPDMYAPYTPDLQKIALQTALELGIPLRRGILFAARGPSYETAAEIQMARRFGADAVTMSTVPEVIVAVSHRMQVMGISCITNLATGLSAGKLDHEEVTETANRIGATFTQLLTGVIKRIA
jgi:purine-nucleoside phosphorylase